MKRFAPAPRQSEQEHYDWATFRISEDVKVEEE